VHAHFILSIHQNALSESVILLIGVVVIGERRLVRKTVCGVMLTLLFIGMLSLAFNGQQVKASGTIYIRGDGSIEGTDKIVSSDNVTYTFTDDIYDSVVVQRNDIVVDGAGYALQGIGSRTGMNVSDRSNVTIRNINIKNFDISIYLNYTSYSVVSGNNITVTANDFCGIYLAGSYHNTVSGNNITDRMFSIWLEGSLYNSISENNIRCEIYANYSSSNILSGNNGSFPVALDHSSNNSIIANDGVSATLLYSSDNSIVENKIDTFGITFSYSSNNSISRNNITDCGFGIRLFYSSNNNISENNVTDSVIEGMRLDSSSNNILRNNSVAGSQYNFGVRGNTFEHFVNDIDASNTVEDKPVYYWINEQDRTVPLDAGYVALINCTRINVQNLNLTKNQQGILLAYTTNSTITENEISENLEGTWFLASSYNSFCKNNIAESTNSGIQLDFSSNIAISGNNITNNGEGIDIQYSSNNSISGNSITANHENGVCAIGSSNNTIIGNNIATNSLYGAFLYSYSNNNTVAGNNITNNGEGIDISVHSDSNTLIGNNVTNNNLGVYIDFSSSNLIYHNNFMNNIIQVDLYSTTGIWDNGYPSGGNYWSDYTDVDKKNGANQDQPGGDGIGDTPYIIDTNNRDRYPLMKTYGIPHDIGITGITSKTAVGQGYKANITLRVMNYGINTETFNLTAYINATVIATNTNITLTSRNSTTVTFTWNTTDFAKGNYTIWANTTSILSETDTSDNTLVFGIVLVGVPCDITGPTPLVPDGVCNMRDIGYVCSKFGTTPSSQDWDPNADVTGPAPRMPDGTVNMRDIGEACNNFGKT
jgi:parallel beta-helix repeat protein